MFRSFLNMQRIDLGVETEGGVFTKMIERNTTIPTLRKEIFTTAADGQPEVEIHVLQGERAMASDNKSLGKFKLEGIAPAPRGIPQVEVAFDIDANGIVAVSAKDLGTGKSQQVTITGGTALDSGEIDRMIKDAESHANEDADRKELAEARNQADHTAYSMEKQLTEHSDKLSDDEKAGVQEKIDAVRKELAAEDASAEALHTATQELMAAAEVIGQKVYEASQSAEAAEGEDQGDGGEDEEIVEAEVVEDDEEA